MRRAPAIFGTLVFLLLAPGLVAGVVPWWITRWKFPTPFPCSSAFRILGVALIVLGIPALLDSFARFAWQGVGTPAPLFPTRHLVVTGFYRYVRNPMYVGAAAVIFGQGLLFGNVQVFEYLLCVLIAAHAFVVWYEEPKLATTFGDEYRRFRENVPRWIPRLTPWGNHDR